MANAAKLAAGPLTNCGFYSFKVLALAHLQNWIEAHQALGARPRKPPNDARFPVESRELPTSKKFFCSEGRTPYSHTSELQHAYPGISRRPLFSGCNIEAALKYWIPSESRSPSVAIAPPLQPSL